MGIKFLHIILSILLFFNTSGIEVNSHFCSGKYKYSSIFVQPKNCCKKVNGHLPSKDSCQDEANQTPCCQNKTKLIKSNYPQNINSDITQEVNLPTFNLAINSFLQYGQSHFQRLDIDYFNYKPPLIRLDFTILFQVFRC